MGVQKCSNAETNFETCAKILGTEISKVRITSAEAIIGNWGLLIFFIGLSL